MLVPVRKRTLLLLILACGITASLLAALLLAEFHREITRPFLEAVDLSVTAGIHAHDTPPLTRLAFALSFIGSPGLLVPVVILIAAVLWMCHMRRDGALLVLGLGGSGLLDTALKLHFKRLRPDVPWAFVHEHSFSFPSGHSVGAVVLYGSLTYLVWSRLEAAWQRAAVIVAALVLITGIGLSRVYLGVHYPTDIAAGYAVGLIWLAPLIAGSEFIARRDTPPNRVNPPGQPEISQAAESAGDKSQTKLAI